MRKNTKEIKIGSLWIGGHHKIAIQSMTNTKTSDTDATIVQIHALEKAGCDIVRVAVLDEADAYAIQSIVKAIHIPLVADIHFDYRLALISLASGVQKLRINPGNIGSIERIREVVEACKLHQVPIRIGVNLGSLDCEIREQYGRTAMALVKSAEKHVRILEELDFHDIVISMKASDVPMTIEAYEIASRTFSYPLHIGVTETGTFFSGSIKSAVGLGSLLYQGIGDTLRVSLTDDPVQEVLVAQEIMASLGYFSKPTLISCPTCGRTQYNMIPIAKEIETFLQTLPHVSFKVAVMGCVVNGPGEAKDADIGVAGGKEEALLFKKGIAIRKIPQDKIVAVLKEEINKMIEKVVSK
ncbi:MAG: flavodoxin-dependent (E)-4-hydroxy-3-methylbut-2-enyl-diphosphate synthase [Bacilli bacterium]|nr:flavodoxin-dependent (E)-4-hydroxy-3-methylbut-2-enyl-diphosphate synthase [Bacilli bacterium]